MSRVGTVRTVPLAQPTRCWCDNFKVMSSGNRHRMERRYAVTILRICITCEQSSLEVPSTHSHEVALRSRAQRPCVATRTGGMVAYRLGWYSGM
ncbi:hypothetical protein JG687_00018601 [Phytophthora cactorum]|uniref:Uncharacterized protein n=1 Tax=Phytophthora cactorum TaxID=29920 RepID=A0A8T1TKL3_9STRA|nr:hypothetical protein GQ600_18646 [Phytophthora cactorum]KAG6943211.1 hypothetical protein JG687_00018601 [Phytophthora cactorum]